MRPASVVARVDALGRRGTRGVALLLAVTLLLAALAPAALAAGRAAKGRGAAKESVAVANPAVRAHRVVAYYFHTTQRCASCRAIEAYSREAIEGGFADAIRDGRLVWRVVNIETKGNEHFVKDYGLYTKSLVLVDEVRGVSSEWKNLDKVWQLLNDKPKFLRYVEDETRAFLAGHS